MSCLGEVWALLSDGLCLHWTYVQHVSSVCCFACLTIFFSFTRFFNMSSRSAASTLQRMCCQSSQHMVKCLEWERPTKQPHQRFMFEHITSFTNKYKCVCGCTQFTASTARSLEGLSLWLILSSLCWYQRGGTECKKDYWRQECFEGEQYSVSFLNVRLDPGWDFCSQVMPYPVHCRYFYSWLFLFNQIIDVSSSIQVFLF